MAMTMSDFKTLLDKCNVRYFQHPVEPMVIAGFGGALGNYQITMGLQADGTFLQFRTQNYATCRADSPHLSLVQTHLLHLNLRARWVKWTWDPRTGEIIVMGDHWIMDSTVTSDQFNRMLSNMVPVIDMETPRIKAIIETGKDPGEIDPDELLKRTTGHGGSPEPSGAPQPVTEI